MEDGSPRGILSTLRKVEKEDFDICITSHGRPANREEFKEFIDYMDDLISQVDRVVKELYDDYGGTDLMSLVDSIADSDKIDLSKYKDWGRFENWSKGNIEGVFHSIYMGY